MPIPVITIPKQGPIATRPRRESIYDTEGWDDGATIASRLSVFRNSQTFANTSLGLSKIKGRDHNLDGQGGQMPKGQMFHWYGVANKIRPLGANLQGAAVIAVFDVIRRIREVTWWTFFFGTNAPFFTVPTWQIPQGAGIVKGQTQHNATTFIGNAAEVERGQIYDVTLNGVPTEISELESFSVDVESSGVQPTPTVDLYNSVVLKGVLFKGIQG